MDIGQVVVGLDYQRFLAQLKTWSELSLDEIGSRLKENQDVTLYERGKVATDVFFGKISQTLQIAWAA